ncbi:GNAT family N-acetyltransferase [Streptomyces sp. NPDC058613]|uniref:GNAT family N-acetyltransferase n=1 Tax=unclassified Streptomyces TaxID=2593676 RepID=UPI003661B82E
MGPRDVRHPFHRRSGSGSGSRVRQRLRDSFSAQHTSIIMIDRELAGCVALRPADGGQLLEHFYLAPHHQGRGLGSAVLRTLLEHTDARGMTVRLNVLRGSAAQRLYERHGFAVEVQDPIDVFMVRGVNACVAAAMPSPTSSDRPGKESTSRRRRQGRPQ